MKFLNRAVIIAAAFITVACAEKANIDPVTPTPTPDPPQKELKPAACDNKIVAHRGGAAESGNPDNSRAGVKYAMSQKIYAVECDIYWTKDDNIVIAHANSDYKINGLLPWENTLAQLRAGGTLKNGETLPSLDDVLEIVMVEGNCTRLCLDIKYTSPVKYAQNAVITACKIIKAKKGEAFCEFICSGNTSIASTAATCMTAYNIPIGWMSDSSPANHKKYGFSWANLSAKSYMTPYGSRTIDEFVSAGMQISVFNVDKAGSTDSNAVTSANDVKYYIDNYSKLRCICTNYPQWLKKQL